MKTIIVIICILLLALSGCSWSHRDKSLMAVYLAAETVDILQTREIFNNDDYYEINPMLTKENYLPMMIGGTILLYLMADLLPEGWRTALLLGAISFKGVVIYNNYSIGVKF